MPDLTKKINEHFTILAAGDLHGDTLLAERLADKADKENADLVILCGDLTNFEESTDHIIGPFVKKNKKVLLIPGNHESIATADFLATLYGAKNIHGYSVRYKNIGIFGCGLANVGPSQLHESEFFSVLKEGFDKVKYLDKTIMVTHVHPAQSKMEKFSTFVPGSTGVKKAIDTLRPDILLCSHVHEAEGIEERIGKTLVLNVGKEGKIIRI